MSEWRQTITVICTVILAFAALAAFMQTGLSAVRTEMQSEFGAVRSEMQFEHATLRAEIAGVRDQLNSVDRRMARIEGQLFGIEIEPEQLNGE